MRWRVRDGTSNHRARLASPAIRCRRADPTPLSVVTVVVRVAVAEVGPVGEVARVQGQVPAVAVVAEQCVEQAECRHLGACGVQTSEGGRFLPGDSGVGIGRGGEALA